MKQMKYFLFLLILNFSFINSNKEDEEDSRDFFGILFSIFQGLERKCFPELKKIYDEFKDNVPELDKSYPWLFDTVGKSLNDIGDEAECVNTLKNTSFIMINLYNITFFEFVQNVSKHLYNFLELKNYSVGFCVMDECKDTFYRYIQLAVRYANSIANKNDSIDQVTFIENSKSDVNSTINVLYKKQTASYMIKHAFLIIITLFILLKLIGGLGRIIFLPKGYNKYILAKQNKAKNGIKNDDMEEKEIVKKKRGYNKEIIDEDNNNKEYDPLFDYTDKLPLYFKILKLFDIWDDLFYLTSVRNKYSNDLGLDVINFNRTIMIFLLTFSYTFSAFIELPSEEIINSSFFKSPLNIFYRLSNNALTCWIFLEGAHTTYKLLCFISNETFIYNAKEYKNKKNFNVRLLIIYGKFLLLLLPKIIEFFTVYYVFYHCFEDYSFFIDRKATFTHIIRHIFNSKIKCDSFKSLFEKIFSSYFSDYDECYEFIHFYLNMFLTIIFSMIIIYLFFLIKNPIFEIIIMVANFVFYFVSNEIITDPKIEDENYLLEYHIIGQTYTTKVIYSFVGCFHLGLITGFILFNYEGSKKRINKLIYENYLNYFSERESIKCSDKALLEDDESSSISSNSNNNNDNEIKNRIRSFSLSISYTQFKLPYYPLKFLNTKILVWIKSKGFYTKILIILLCLIIMVFEDYILILVIITDKNKSFKIPLTTPIKSLFQYEKHIFIFLFFIINVVMITLPKKGILRDLMSSRIVVFVSRIGFLLSCVVFGFTYLLFIVFNLRVKLFVPTIFLMTFGNFLLICLLCFFYYSLVEFPLHFLIKTILRIGRNREKASI